MLRGGSGSDRGAGTPLVVGLIAVVCLVSLAMLGGAHALVRGQQLSAAADAAALAAADAQLGWVPGEPCAMADRVTAAHAARLAECRGEGLTVIVRVEASILGMTISRSARAGPPDTR